MATPMLDIPLGTALSEEQAHAICAQGEAAVMFAVLTLAKMLAEQQAAAVSASHQTPSTRSGMKPPYQKPAASTRGKKRPGRKPGHAGSRREPPARIDRREEHRAEVCPHCGGALCQCKETRTRYTEDIPKDIQPEVTEHTIHCDWCPRCKKKVEPVVSAALPGETLGNRVLIVSAWLHYALGNTLAQIVEVFNFHLSFKVTPGGLVSRRGVMAPPGADPGDMVRSHPARGVGIGRAQCRRNRLARQWQDPLALVFRQRRVELVYDRPVAGQSGATRCLRSTQRARPEICGPSTFRVNSSYSSVPATTTRTLPRRTCAAA